MPVFLKNWLTGSLMLLALLVVGGAPPVAAQQAVVVGVCGTSVLTNGGLRPAQMDPTGQLCTSVAPKAAAAVTIAGCTVGTTSATCLAASSAPSSLTIQNTSATARCACTFGATAILYDAGSFMLWPGQSRQWNLGTSGVPTNALKCVSDTASTPLYVEYN